MRIAAAVLVLLAGLVAGLVAVTRDPGTAADATSRAGSAAATQVLAPEDRAAATAAEGVPDPGGNAEASPDAASRGDVGSVEGEGTAAPAERPQPAAVPSPSPLATVSEITHRVANWTGDDYLAATGAAIDGETAYAAFRYALSCVDGITSEDELMLRREQYGRYMESQGQVSEERIERLQRHLENSYAHCGGIGDDVVGLAADWLLLAVDLDYLPALVSFHEDLPALLARRNHGAFRRPDLVALYAERAGTILERALASSHADAFRAHAIALRRGLAVDGDLARAHAMALTAEAIEAGGSLSLRADPSLSAADNDRAHLLAEAMCRRYCP